MLENQIIQTEHKDVIHDISYDYYGQRFASCSSDQMIKVFEQDSSTGIWKNTSSWKAHSGSIWRLCWANPEFGTVLATCSFDRTCSVWEETIEKNLNPTPQKKWVRKANLVDSRTSVTDVKFAPKTLGLQLATSSADGIIRIYEAPDIMNLSHWTLQHEIQCKVPLSCLSWNPSLFRLHAPMIVAGSDATQVNEPKVFIFEFSELNRRWNMTETITSITEPVHDIEFAPSCRSYHVLAVASKDVSIINLKPNLEPSSPSRFDVQMAAQFNDHRSTVWRVTWNVTGTILATTGDDGYIRMWRMNYQKGWKCVCSFKPDYSPDSTNIPISFEQPQSSNFITSSTAKYFKKVSNPQIT